MQGCLFPFLPPPHFLSQSFFRRRIRALQMVHWLSDAFALGHAFLLDHIKPIEPFNVYHTLLFDNSATDFVYSVKHVSLNHVRSTTSTRLCSTMSFQRHLCTWPCLRHHVFIHVCLTKSSTPPRLFNQIAYTSTSVGPRLFDDAFQLDRLTAHAKKKFAFGIDSMLGLTISIK